VKPIRLVKNCPGGLADVIGRIIASSSTSSSARVVIENRGGAGGTIARFAAMRTPTATLMFANTSTMSINPAVYRR
jgi:tripartite-type tricarboxylate transporter receptor subunit TctC